MPLHELELYLRNHDVTVALSTLAFVAGLIAIAAFLAYVGIVLGARTPLTIRFVWPFSGLWDPFKVRRQRQLARELLEADRRRELTGYALTDRRIVHVLPAEFLPNATHSPNNVVSIDARRS